MEESKSEEEENSDDDLNDFMNLEEVNEAASKRAEHFLIKTFEILKCKIDFSSRKVLKQSFEDAKNTYGRESMIGKFIDSIYVTNY